MTTDDETDDAQALADGDETADAQASDDLPAPGDLDVPVRCTLTPEEAKERREALREHLVPELRAVDAIEDGVAFTTTGSSEAVEALTGFVAVESACCSFARYDLTVTPGDAENRLEVTGEGVLETYEEGLEGWLTAADVEGSLPV